MDKGKHFVLVHGSCLGDWSWFKIITALKAAGHRVTALDLGGCGVNPKRHDEINSIYGYVEPLMEFMASLPKEEKVILVGHSYGGISISLAMESFPKKTLAAVYVCAMMPNHNSPPATLFEELYQKWPMESISDHDQAASSGVVPGSPIITPILLGPNFMATNLCNKCQPEDLELAKMLVRPSGLFLNDLSKESLLTKENFGSVSRVFVGCEDDEATAKGFQEWMIRNSPTQDVKFIAGADHMPMLSKPRELFLCLQEIADKNNQIN